MTNKETAYPKFMAMICNSWTWARLSEAERDAFTAALHNNLDNITGTCNQRFGAYNAMYSAFLAGVGYTPAGWRESQ